MSIDVDEQAYSVDPDRSARTDVPRQGRRPRPAGPAQPNRPPRPGREPRPAPTPAAEADRSRPDPNSRGAIATGGLLVAGTAGVIVLHFAGPVVLAGVAAGGVAAAGGAAVARRRRRRAGARGGAPTRGGLFGRRRARAASALGGSAPRGSGRRSALLGRSGAGRGSGLLGGARTGGARGTSAGRGTPAAATGRSRTPRSGAAGAGRGAAAGRRTSPTGAAGSKGRTGTTAGIGTGRRGRATGTGTGTGTGSRARRVASTPGAAGSAGPGRRLLGRLTGRGTGSTGVAGTAGRTQPAGSKKNSTRAKHKRRNRWASRRRRLLKRWQKTPIGRASKRAARGGRWIWRNTVTRPARAIGRAAKKLGRRPTRWARRWVLVAWQAGRHPSAAAAAMMARLRAMVARLSPDAAAAYQAVQDMKQAQPESPADRAARLAEAADIGDLHDSTVDSDTPAAGAPAADTTTKPADTPAPAPRRHRRTQQPPAPPAANGAGSPMPTMMHPYHQRYLEASQAFIAGFAPRSIPDLYRLLQSQPDWMRITGDHVGILANHLAATFPGFKSVYEFYAGYAQAYKGMADKAQALFVAYGQLHAADLARHMAPRVNEALADLARHQNGGSMPTITGGGAMHENLACMLAASRQFIAGYNPAAVNAADAVIDLMAYLNSQGDACTAQAQHVLTFAANLVANYPVEVDIHSYYRQFATGFADLADQAAKVATAYATRNAHDVRRREKPRTNEEWADVSNR